MQLHSLHVFAKQGGFLVRVCLKKGVDEYIEDEYLVPSYGRLMKALKQELQEFTPKRKEKVNADQA